MTSCVTARGRRSLLEVSRAARALAEHLLATPDVRRAATVAAYVSIGTEPGTGPLLDELRARGRRVILPVVLPDLDLDWAVYDGPEQPGAAPAAGCSSRPVSGSASTRSPPPTWCSTPGLAVDRTGMRLGQGGGCYDRALGRVPVGTFTCTLLYDDELLEEVPSGAHDRPVTAVATPVGRDPAARGADPSAVSRRCRDQRQRVVGGGLDGPRENGQASVRPSTHRSVWST